MELRPADPAPRRTSAKKLSLRMQTQSKENIPLVEQWSSIVASPLCLEPSRKEWSMLHAQSSEPGAWEEGNRGMVNRYFDVTSVNDDDKTLTVKFENPSDKVGFHQAFRADYFPAASASLAGAAGEFQKVSNEMTELSKIFSACQVMLHQELAERIQRAQSWEPERAQMAEDLPNATAQATLEEVDRIKTRCDKMEIEQLPKEFSSLWVAIRATVDHKKKYYETSAAIHEIKNWKRMTMSNIREVDICPKCSGSGSLSKWFGNATKPCKNCSGVGSFTGKPTTVTVHKKPLNPFKCLFRLYGSCEALEKEFKVKCREVGKLFTKTGMKCVTHVGGLKGKERAMYKFIYKYNCNARRLTDVLRASFIFHDIASIRLAVGVIHKQFAKTGGILSIKDRIAKPTPVGYMDILLNVRIGNVVCEIQLHLVSFHALKKDCHKTYKVARHFGSMFDQLVLRLS